MQHILFILVKQGETKCYKFQIKLIFFFSFLLFIISCLRYAAQHLHGPSTRTVWEQKMYEQGKAKRGVGWRDRVPLTVYTPAYGTPALVT